MKIAIATEAGKVCPHFGHTPAFTVAVVDRGTVTKRQELPNPGHAPGFLPRWMKDQGVELVIAGGVGSKARDLFASFGIDVIVGASGPIDQVLQAFVDGTLSGGQSLCDHDKEGHKGCGGTCH
jgi:predicted Fe-Mo cluster-binding NifX family protein